MSDMVERVARAIFASFDEITEPEEREDCLKIARDAIEAMRDPTDDMLQAAQDRDAKYIWHEMIDAA